METTTTKKTASSSTETNEPRRYSDIGPRVGQVEQNVEILKNQMGKVENSLGTISAGQDKLSITLLRMEAAQFERERSPKTQWWQYVAGAATGLGFIVSFAVIESWFFQAQLNTSLAPVQWAQREAALDTKHDIEKLQARLARYESAFEWKPTLREKVLEFEIRR